MKTITGVAAIGIAFAAGEIFQRSSAAAAGSGDGLVFTPAGTQQQGHGYTLFMQKLRSTVTCGADARGDEGPDLHGVTKSDARIASLIKDGKRLMMPKFSSRGSAIALSAGPRRLRFVVVKGITAHRDLPVQTIHETVMPVKTWMPAAECGSLAGFVESR